MLFILLVPVFALAASAGLGLELDGQVMRAAYHQGQAVMQAYPVLAALAFAAAYTTAVALSVPGATWLTLLGGALFGPWLGSLLVASAATAGAVIVFLLAAHGGRADWVQRAGPWMSTFEHAIRQNAVSALLFMRLVPLFPFWLVNLVPAFLGVPLAIYGVTTFVGILPATVLYAMMGDRLQALMVTGDTPELSLLTDWTLWLPLVLLGCLALAPMWGKRLWRRQATKCSSAPGRDHD